MAVGTRGAWGLIQQFIARKDMVESLRASVQPFRPQLHCATVTDDIASVCLSPKAMEDYIAEYHTFLTKDYWKWKLVLSTRLDMDKAWIRPTELEFWEVEGSENIGRTCCWRSLDFESHELPKIHIRSVGEILALGHHFRDADLCYCFQEQPDYLLVTELFYLTTIHGRSGWVTSGTHKWKPHNLDDWESTIFNLVGFYDFSEQPGSLKLYQK